jgi:hypothetical protein
MQNPPSAGPAGQNHNPNYFEALKIRVQVVIPGQFADEGGGRAGDFAKSTGVPFKQKDRPEAVSTLAQAN